MAISKQNRVIGVVATIFLTVTGISFYKYKKNFAEGAFLKVEGDAISQKSNSEINQAVLAGESEDPINRGSDSENLKRSEHQVFLQIADDLAECMALKLSLPVKEQSHLETLLEGLSSFLGEPLEQTDRWNSWKVKTIDGRDREYRLEVIESDAGKITRELHAYAFDQSGDQIPMELDEAKSKNPSEEYLKEVLNAGEVTSKNRAGSVSFSTGERLDFIEINGDLIEIEFSKMNQIFRCNTIKARETCQCLN